MLINTVNEKAWVDSPSNTSVMYNHMGKHVAPIKQADKYPG